MTDDIAYLNETWKRDRARRENVMLAKLWGLALVAIVLACVVSCGASAREKTIATTLAATKAATAGFVAYDAKHQLDLVAGAKDDNAAALALQDWRNKQAAIQKYILATYQAIAAAAVINDEASVSDMVTALAELAAQLKADGVVP